MVAVFQHIAIKWECWPEPKRSIVLYRNISKKGKTIYPESRTWNIHLNDNFQWLFRQESGFLIVFWSLHPIFTLLAATWMRPQWVFVRSTAADFNAVRYTISTHFNMAWFETKISWLSRCKYNFSQHLDHESLAAISTKYQHKLQRKHCAMCDWSDTCRYPVCP